MTKFISICIIFFGLAIQSCSLFEDDQEVIRINYGTSFGECMGFCLKDLTMENDSITYNQHSWYPSIQTRSCRNVNEKSLWNYYQTNLDQGYFMGLPDVIGCPDCADGGAEWLEVEFANRDKHKVTFEYRNAPKGLKSYIENLRDLMVEGEDCAFVSVHP